MLNYRVYLLLLILCSLAHTKGGYAAVPQPTVTAQECALSGANVLQRAAQLGDASYLQQDSGDPAYSFVAAGTVGGSFTSVALTTNRVLMGEGSGLLTVETTPTLRRLGRLELDDMVRDIAVVDGIAYVAAGEAGLQIIDVASAATPTLVSVLRLPGLPFALEVAAGRVYVAAAGAGGGLQIVDVSVATRPRLLSSFAHYGSASGIALRDSLAFVSGGLAGGLQIVDVSDPRVPVLRGELITPGVARGVVLAGERAYLAAGFCGLQQIDVSDPTQPQLLGALATPGDALSVAVSGETLFVAASEGGLVSFTIGGANPQLGSVLALPGEASDLVLSGTTLYVAGGSAGLHQLVSAPTPSLQATLAAFVPSGPLVANDERVAAAQAAGGLRLLDLAATNPLASAPSVLTPTLALAARGDALYLANADGLVVYDVADPLTLTLRTTLALSGTVRGLMVADERIYVAADSAGVLVLDASDAFSPTLSASWPVSNTARTVAISGTLALVAERSQISLRNAANGALIGRVNLSTGVLVHDALLHGVYAYLATSDGLLVVDINETANPTVVFRRSGFAAYSLAAESNRLYVAAGASGVQVYSLTEAARPVLRGSRRTLGPALGLVLVNGQLLVAAESGGLRSYNLRALPMQLWLPVIQ